MIRSISLSLIAACAAAGGPPTQPQPPGRKTEVAAVQAPATGPVLEDIGSWLVNLARHQGHIVGRTDPRSASLHVIALLEAAAAADPQCAAAYFWLYDLYQRLEHSAQARAALSRYVHLRPGNDAARLKLLELELAERQTALERAEFVRAELKKPSLSAAYESELRRWLADYHFERRETQAASLEIEGALRLNPMNVAARELAYEMFGETEPALQRVEMALQLIAISPGQANVVWDLAEYLDRLSLHRQAQEWYNRAIELHRRDAAAPIPASFWHRLAVSCLSSGDLERAREAADQALASDGNCHPARLLRAGVLTRLGDAKAAAADLDVVLKDCQARAAEVFEKKRYDLAAEIAWFYAYHHPDKEQALKFSKLAMEEHEPSSLARLAYGYALHANGLTDDARKVLEKLAPTDQMAALELARIDAARGDKQKAVATLLKAAALQYSGMAYELIKSELGRLGEAVPQPPLHAKIVSTLEKFPRDVFDFHKRPSAYLKCTARFVTDPLPAVGPVNVALRLENVGPFTISLGEGFMVRPFVSLSTTLGAGGRTHRNYLQVLVNSRPWLVPGDAVEQIVSIDVGPVRDELLRNCARNIEVEVTALLDPVNRNGELSEGAGTIVFPPLKAVRPAVPTSVTAVAALLQRAADAADAAVRAHAALTLGALLADAEHNKNMSPASKLALDDLRDALATLLADPDWSVRARAVEAAGWTTLGRATTAAAAKLIRDDNAVVKMLAVRLFAVQHGERFKQVLANLSKNDPSHLVRLMATSYLPPGEKEAVSGAQTRANIPEP